MEPSTELDDLVYAVIGAAIEVHRLLGPGFLESVYEEALCVELTLRGIRFARQLPIGVQYKGQKVGEARLDLVVHDSLVIERKAVEGIAPIHVAQILSRLLESHATSPRPTHQLQRHDASAWHQARHLYTIKLWRSQRLGGSSCQEHVNDCRTLPKARGRAGFASAAEAICRNRGLHSF